MEEQKSEQKYRVSGYVSEKIYEKLIDMQTKERIETGKKPTMGEVIEKLVNARG